MTSNGVLTLPDRGICLICNSRPRAGNDDLCVACTCNRLASSCSIVRFIPTSPPRPVPCREGEFASGLQENAIRILEEECR